MPPPAADDWWQPYTEEWLVPPVERAVRTAEKQSFYSRLSSPLVRMLLLKGASVSSWDFRDFLGWLTLFCCSPLDAT